MADGNEKVTYSTIADRARILNMSTAEYAKQHYGLSESDLAAMKLAEQFAKNPDEVGDLSKFKMSGRFVIDLPDGRKVPFEVDDLANALINGISFEDSKDFTEVEYLKEMGVLRLKDSNGKTYEAPMSEAIQKQLTAKVDEYKQQKEAEEYAKNKSLADGSLKAAGFFAGVGGAIASPIIAGAVAGAAALASCDSFGDDEIKEIKGEEVNVTQINEQIVTADLKNVEALLTTVIANQLKGQQQDQKNHDELIAAINQLKADLTNSNNANKNEILTAIKAFQNAVDNHASEFEIALKALGVLLAANGEKLDQINEKLEKANQIFDEIKGLIINLPDALKEKFQSDIDAIIAGIADNGDKLDSIKCILRWINANVIRNNQLTADNGKKLGEILKGLKDFKNMTKDQLNTIIGLIKQNNCLTAQGNAKLDAIYKKMTKGFGDLAALLCRLDENQERRNDKVINAIHNAANQVSGSVYDVGGQVISAMCDGFNRLYELDAAGFNAVIDGQNTTNSLLADIDSVTRAIYNKPTVDITPIVRELQNNGVTLNAIYAGMSVINDNIVQSDANQTAIGKKVIELLYCIEDKMPADYTNILCAILNKIPDGFPQTQGNVNLGGIEQRLDAILCAIKNHEVEVKVDVNGKCHCCDNDTPEKPDKPCNPPSDPAVHEGVKTDLDWLLG